MNVIDRTVYWFMAPVMNWFYKRNPAHAMGLFFQAEDFINDIFSEDDIEKGREIYNQLKGENVEG